MTHVEELCLNLESAYLAIDREIGVVLRAALVADKVEAAKPPPQPRPSEGMSRVELRQRAAIAAIQGMLADPTFESEASIVEIAVGMADALVAELERTQQQAAD